jgi:hypothetical protein
MTMQIDVKGIENMMSFPSLMIMVLRKEKINSKRHIFEETLLHNPLYIWSLMFCFKLSKPKEHMKVPPYLYQL